MRRMGWLLGVGLGALAGCATGSSAVVDTGPAESSMRAAREVGAEQEPQAALHLRLAQDETEQAKKMLQDGDNDRAALLLRRAQADGELAIALAKDAQARNDAQQATDRVQQLRQQQQPAQQGTP